MKNDIEQFLSTIKNPLSGKSLSEEGRWGTIETGEKVMIEYNREGIDPATKRNIEDQIYAALSSDFDEEKVFIKTTSQDSSDVYKKPGASAPKESANLKVGHEQQSEKKRVPGAKKVIAIASGKGGVGKSTFSVNLAMTLKQQGKKVGLIDADIYGPSVPMLLNKRGEKPQSTSNKKIKPIEALGIKFISFGLFVEEKDAVIWRGPMLGGVLSQFLFDTEWGDLDYLLIDLPPGTGDVQLSMSQSTEVDGAIIISTPQDVALLDSKKGLQMFNKVKIPILGLVENMSYFAPDDSDKKYYIFGSGGVEKASKELDVDFLGGIPLEIALREGADSGRPYMSQSEQEGRPAWNAYMEICKKLVTITSDNSNKGFLGRLFNK
jgi:ATP-binding protein involved in chromosome partitioning